MVYILTSTKTILETEVRAQESRAGDNIVEGLLALKLKPQLLAESYNEQQQYVNAAAIASYISLNKLDQRNRYRASVGLHSVTGNDYSFTKGSSSSGLGYALALFETWWNVVLKKKSKFPHPVFATGEILTSGAVSKISHLSEKLDAVCTYVEANRDNFQQFYVCFPMENEDEIADSIRDVITNLGGILLPVNRIQELLCTILGNDYDGDPLGRWQPFKGLNSFEYEDSVRFFGREKDVERLYDDIKQNNGLLIVAGASGSGKSSLIKAGLIPRIEQDSIQLHWAYTTPSFSANDKGIMGFVFEQLNIAWGLEEYGLVIEDLSVTFNHSFDEGIKKIKPFLNDQSKHCLLYLDQYEEVFSENHENIDFIYKELKLIDKISSEFEQLDIVLALRNEYLGRLLENQALLSPVISNVSSHLPPDDWHAIIHEQAAFSGINFEHDEKDNSLDKIIIAEAVQTQYALPMVEFLLEQLYLKTITKSPGTNTLLFEHYEEMSGLSGAIAYRAQAVLDKHKASKYLIGSFFEHFVGLNNESLPYGRHVHIEEIKSQDLKLYELVLGLIDANLIVYTTEKNDAGVLKLSHDSLFSHWQRLEKWIESYQDYLIWRNNVDGLFQRWQEHSKGKKYLLKDKGLINEGLFFIKDNILKNNLLKKYIKVSKSKINLTNINIFVYLFFIPALISSVFYWDYNRVKNYYYSEIGEKWNIPFGINKLTDEEASRLTYVYHLEYQKRKLRKIQYLNGSGRLVPHYSKNKASIWEYEYLENGVIDKIVIKLANKRIYHVKKFNSLPDNKAVINFSNTMGGIDFIERNIPFSLVNDEFITGKSKVNRHLVHYDENGYVKKIIYQNPYGVNISDSFDRYGAAYKYNKDGLVTEEMNLSKRGKFISVNGVYKKLYEYNSRSKIKSISFLDIKGNLVLNKNGYAKSLHKYDFWGNEIEQSFYDQNEVPVLHTEGFSKAHYKFDSRGNIIEETYYGVNGREKSRKQGVAKILSKYDGKGFQVQTLFYDVNNNLVIASDGSGCAGANKMYDSHDNQVGYECLGLFMKPIMGKNGAVKVTYSYNSNNLLVKVDYFGMKGKPLLINDGFASEKYEYDTESRVVSKSYFGVDGQLINTENGYATKETFKYDVVGNIEEWSFFDSNNNVALSEDGYARMRGKHNDEGLLIEEAYYGLKNEPVFHKDGYHKKTTQYDDFGNIKQSAAYGIKNNPVLIFMVASKINSKYDSRNNLIEEEYLGISGEPIQDENMYSKILYQYDDNDQLVIKKYVNFKGQRVTENSLYYYSISQKYRIHENNIKNDSSTNDKFLENLFWIEVLEKDNKDGYAKYMEKYPNGIYYEKSNNEMKKFTSDIIIRTNNEKNKIVINDVFYGYQKVNLIMRPGKYSINIYNDEYFPHQEFIDLKDGESIKLDIKLKKNDSHLSSVEELVSKSNSGLSDYQQSLCNYYFNSSKDNSYMDEAIYWCDEAAQQGNIKAQRYLGMIYMDDRYGVDQDLKKSVRWLRAAALQNDLASIIRLALILDTDKQNQDVLNLSLRAAKLGSSLLYYKLAGSYMSGEYGAEKDIIRALYWYQKYVQENDLNHKFLVNGYLELANTYFELAKEGYPIGFPKAAYWFEKAADDGDSYSAHQIGIFYLYGIGLTKNDEKALYWLNEAALKDNKKAIQKLKYLKKRN